MRSSEWKEQVIDAVTKSFNRVYAINNLALPHLSQGKYFREITVKYR